MVFEHDPIAPVSGSQTIAVERSGGVRTGARVAEAVGWRVDPAVAERRLPTTLFAFAIARKARIKWE